MKRTTLLTLIFTVVLVVQSSLSYAASPGPCLLDPRDGMYMTRIINLTGEQLSIAVANDTSNSTFANTEYANLYSTGFSTSNNSLNNQQNIFTSTPIKLDTLVQHSKTKKYAIPAGNAYWEGMINLCPLIPASNENKSYATYSGHFSQGQRLTITTVNNPSSILNGAYVQLGYVYSSTKQILWGNVFDFAFSTIKNAAHIAAACEDEDVKAGIKAGASMIKDIVGAVQTSPVTASLNSASTLSQQPSTTQTSEFTKQTTKNYAQAMAFFAGSGGGLCITDSSTNNQIYTLASAKQVVVTLTASDQSIRYFTAPAYYIYIKNVQAPTTGDINECTIAVVDGWVYNLAVGMHQYTGNAANLQNLTPVQMMYYAGSKIPPVASPATSTAPSVNVTPATGTGVTITNVAISYIGG